MKSYLIYLIKQIEQTELNMKLNIAKFRIWTTVQTSQSVDIEWKQKFYHHHQVWALMIQPSQQEPACEPRSPRQKMLSSYFALNARSRHARTTIVASVQPFSLISATFMDSKVKNWTFHSWAWSFWNRDQLFRTISTNFRAPSAFASFKAFVVLKTIWPLSIIHF